jgi:hypothetical protein
MELVEKSGKHDECYGSQFDLDDVRLLELQTSIRKQRENEIFGDVAELSDDSMPDVDFMVRQSREYERQDRNDDPRRFCGSESIRREEENDQKPNQKRDPIFDDKFLH